MRLVLAVAGLLLGAAPVSAQYIPRPVAPIGADSAQDAAEIVQAMGFDPVGPAARSGRYHVQRARDPYGRVVRVTVDARRSQIVAVERGGVSAPYAGRGFYRRPYPGYAAMPQDDEDFAPPGSITGSRPYPPATLPPARSASVTPNAVLAPNAAPTPRIAPAVAAPPKPAAPKTASAPTPRKRPASAPQEAVGSVEPISPPPSAAPVPTPGSQTPPVTPLE